MMKIPYEDLIFDMFFQQKFDKILSVKIVL